jgi:hypothetical protein
MGTFKNRGKPREDAISDEIVSIWGSKPNCNYEYEPTAGHSSADILLICDTGTVAVEVKSYPPNMSTISQITGFAEEYKKENSKSIHTAVVYSGQEAPVYVREFANENNVKLYPIKNVKKTLEQIESDFHI